jgi:hypothetical protein
VFLKRLREELAARGLSANALSGHVGGPPQRTLADVLNGADPRLKTVAQIATALGLEPWRLFVEGADHGSQTHNVVHIPPASQRPLAGQSDKYTARKGADRKKRGA